MKNIYLPLALVLLIASSSYTQQRQLTLETPQSEQRVALVIGNSAYETAPLKNSVNDAQDIAQALRELSFEVIYRENLDQNSMKRAIRTFGEKIRQGGVGLFYFAGHGVQVKGENYLVPIGAKVESEEEVEYEGVNAGFILAQMESARNSTNIVILDACRNNPFARSFRSESRGLAVMDAPSGTLIAYATAPGSVASDGNARNGIYTQELLRFMRTPNLGIEEVFKKVRISVRNLTQGRQTPWEASSLVGDFYFLKGSQPSDAATTQPVTSSESVDPLVAETGYWESIKDSRNPDDFKLYLKKYPNGRYAVLATNRLNSLLPPAVSKITYYDPKGFESFVGYGVINGEAAFDFPVLHHHKVKSNLVDLTWKAGRIIISRNTISYIAVNDERSHEFTYSRNEVKEIKIDGGLWLGKHILIKLPDRKDQNFAISCFGNIKGKFCDEPNSAYKFFTKVIADFDTAVQEFNKYRNQRLPNNK